MTRSTSPQRRVHTVLLSLIVWLLITGVSAAEPAIHPGDRFPSLVLRGTTYRDVTVRSVNARTVVITHAGGMASLHLRDLSPELQARFGYDPEAVTTEAEPAARMAPTAVPATPPPALPRRTQAPKTATAPGTAFEPLIRKFGRPVELQAEVDLRPKYFALELGVKSQGRRPSCAVFAVVSALEFQNAQINGRAEKFSEEYLIWATRRILQRPPREQTDVAADPGGKDDADEGFALLEVVAALRGYGIPLQGSMPNTFGRAMAAIDDPPPTVVEEARHHQRVAIYLLPGRDNATRINNLLHALNAGLPVPVGLAWPNFRSLRNGYLSEQQPMIDRGHAVTLVGYRAATNQIEDTLFIFKNSWGVNWGQGGYGTMTYHYLVRHLQSAVLLEVQRE